MNWYETIAFFTHCLPKAVARPLNALPDGSLREIRVRAGQSIRLSTRQSGNEVFLEERIRARDRDYDHDGNGHANRFAGHLGPVLMQGNAGSGVVGHVLQRAHDVVQKRLQGDETFIGNVQGRKEPVVPVAEAQEQGDGGEQRLGNGHEPGT